MSDIFSKDKRKKIMASVKEKDTGPEITIRKFLFSEGYRFTLYEKDLPGKPDIVFTKRKKIILVNGCFWHGHNCKRGKRVPKTNIDYWRKKINSNVQRDKKTISKLGKLGWRVKVVWECEISKKKFISDLKQFLGPPKRTLKS